MCYNTKINNFSPTKQNLSERIKQTLRVPVVVSSLSTKTTACSMQCTRRRRPGNEPPGSGPESCRCEGEQRRSDDAVPSDRTGIHADQRVVARNDSACSSSDGPGLMAIVPLRFGIWSCLVFFSKF